MGFQTSIRNISSLSAMKDDIRGFKNYLINGNFDIWQRSTTQNSTKLGYGSDDRWQNNYIGSTRTHSRVSFNPGDTYVPGNPSYFSRTVVTSVANAANYVLKSQSIEGVSALSGKTATISLYAKADSPKNIMIELLQGFGVGGSTSVYIPVSKFGITSTWNKYSFTVDIPSIAGKTVGNNSGIFLIIWFEAGSNWNSRTLSLGQQSGTFDIAQVQIEEGSVATSFEQRQLGLELLLCQRYFETGQWYGFSQNNTSGGLTLIMTDFKAVKRITPTTTTAIAYIVSGASIRTGALESANDNSIHGYGVCNTSGTFDGSGTFTADAEL